MRRFWIGFEESWVKAILVDTPDDISLEQVIEKVEGLREIKFAKEEDFFTKPWQYTDTEHKFWEELI